MCFKFINFKIKAVKIANLHILQNIYVKYSQYKIVARIYINS